SAGDLPPANNGWDTLLTTVNFLNISDVHVFSPTVLNEFDLGVRMGPHNTSSNSTNGIKELTDLGLPVPTSTPNVGGLPEIDISDVTPVVLGNADAESDSRLWTVRDVVTWVKGRLTTKFGFEGVNNPGTSISYGGVFGTYNFSGLFTGSGFGDLLLGLPSNTARSFPSGVTGS